MLKTYKGVLRGDRIEWLDRPPRPGRPVPVHVTLLADEPGDESTSRGQEMAHALASLADLGGISTITDASAWQREIREDRPLDDRQG